MRDSINTTAKKLWRMMQSKPRRDAYVAAHISNTVASQILMLREAKGWTQKQLAEKCGMRQSRISTLEDPNYENFEAATLRRLASAFDVALTIRFIPFSELTCWTATLSSDKFVPEDFAHDSLPAQTPVQAQALLGVDALIGEDEQRAREYEIHVAVAGVPGPTASLAGMLPTVRNTPVISDNAAIKNLAATTSAQSGVVIDLAEILQLRNNFSGSPETLENASKLQEQLISTMEGVERKYA
jgi:transcriptional regulator with XRE-family HTH domain